MLVRQVLVWFVPRAGCRPRGWWRAGHAVQRGCLGAHGHQREVRREVSHDLSARFTERRPRNLANTTSGGRSSGRSVWQGFLARRSSGRSHTTPATTVGYPHATAHAPLAVHSTLATPAPALLAEFEPRSRGLLVGHVRDPRYLRCQHAPTSRVGVRGALAVTWSAPAGPRQRSAPQSPPPAAEGPQSCDQPDPVDGSVLRQRRYDSQPPDGSPGTPSQRRAHVRAKRQIRRAHTCRFPYGEPAGPPAGGSTSSASGHNSVVNRPACDGTIHHAIEGALAVPRGRSGEIACSDSVVGRHAPTPPTSLDCRRPTPAHSESSKSSLHDRRGRFNRFPGGEPVNVCAPDLSFCADGTEPRVGCSGWPLRAAGDSRPTVWRGNVFAERLRSPTPGPSPRDRDSSAASVLAGAVVDPHRRRRDATAASSWAR